MGDAVLIKDTHLTALRDMGMNLKEIVLKAKKNAPRGMTIEVEVSVKEEALEAAEAGADIIMLDNFSLEDTKKAVELSRGKAKIEASGGINDDTLIDIAQAGVDYVSMGTLTKDVTAVDLSMRLYMEA